MLDHQKWFWILAFSLVDFTNRVFFGVYNTLLGPAQPYIAKNTGVAIDTVTLIWTFCKQMSNRPKSFVLTFRLSKASEHCEHCEKKYLLAPSQLTQLRQTNVKELCLKICQFFLRTVFTNLMVCFRWHIMAGRNPALSPGVQESLPELHGQNDFLRLLLHRHVCLLLLHLRRHDLQRSDRHLLHQEFPGSRLGDCRGRPAGIHHGTCRLEKEFLRGLERTR